MEKHLWAGLWQWAPRIFIRKRCFREQLRGLNFILLFVQIMHIMLFFLIHKFTSLKFSEPTKEVLSALGKLGFSSFRPGQQEAVMRILCGE